MEKVETSKCGGYSFQEWRLTETNKKDIRNVLRSLLGREVSKEKIETFMYHLEFICVFKKTLVGQSKKAEIRAIRERILIDCKAALEHLRQINKGKTYPLHIDNIDYYEEEGDIDDDFIFQMLDTSEKAFGPLEEFIKVIEEYHKSEVIITGRDRADSDHFVRRIKDLYIEHIGKEPTAYGKGCFFTVVQKILEVVGLPHEDPSKSIRAAFKKQKPKAL